MLKTTWFLFCIELRLLLRHSQEWIYPLGFFIIILSLFPLSITPDPLSLQKIMPGGIWLAACFAHLLSISTLFQNEIEDGHLDMWIISNRSLTLLISTKLFAHWLLTACPLILLTPFFGIAFHLSFAQIKLLCLSLLLGTPLLTLISSLMVSLTLGLRQHGVLLGLLVLPLISPVLIFGVMMVDLASSGLPILGPLTFLGGVLLLAITCLPSLIAFSLRLSVA